ncbi:MAG: VanZ family protein [Acidobacteriota bacterium]|nr:VanZ family protein [Acidobacteriota bacterium]
MKTVRSVSWARYLWLGFVAALSLLPVSLKDSLHTTGVLHWWGHLAIFAITAMLFRRMRARTLEQISRAVALFFFGVLLEFLQHAIYGNQFEWRDVGTDALGILLGFLIASLAESGKKVA